LFNGNAIDVLPFMKAGKIPQPLFSFGFSNDLGRFPVYENLDALAEFEEKTKDAIRNKGMKQKEAYHFAIPFKSVEKIAGTLDDAKKLYGPIYGRV